MATISPWDAELDDTVAKEMAEKLHDAMDGLGTNESDIIDVLVSHNTAQRLKIADTYTPYGNLIDDLKGELGGDLEDAIIGLMTPRAEYDAMLLHDAICGPGTCENTLVGILCTANNQELCAIKEKYKEKYDVDLVEDLQCDTSGDFGKMIYALAASERQEECADDEQAEVEAEELKQAGVEQWGTDESKFNFILCNSSNSQIRRIMEKYEEKAEKSLIDTINDEFDGPLKDGYLAMVKCAKDQIGYFAERIYKAMAGFGTDDHELMRIIISRAEIDLQYIKERYPEYSDGVSLDDAVCDETSGDFEKVLRCIIHGRSI